MLTIHFEDKGQDFLFWKVDAAGAVIESGPFQGWVWVDCKVIGAQALREGDLVDFADRNGKLHTLSYRVARIEAR